MVDIHPAAVSDNQAIQRKLSTSSSSDVEKVGVECARENDKGEGAEERPVDKKLRALFYIGLAALVLGWWISSTVLKATRGRWQVCRFQDSRAYSKNLQGCTNDLCLVLLDVGARLCPIP